MKNLLFICLVQAYTLAMVSTLHRCNFERPRNCEEVQLAGNNQSGIYTIFLDDHVENNGTQVFCDMETDGGGWTVFQRRMDGEIQEDFYRGWDDYVNGFGSLSEGFWLELDAIAEMVKDEDKSLGVDLEDFEGEKRYAEYKSFAIHNANDQYRLSLLNCYSGNAGNSLAAHVGRQFSTKDQDNDLHPGNCAELMKGAWWYFNCHASNLNGMYLRGNHSLIGNGVIWYSWKGHYYSLKKTEMKIRRTNYNCLKDAISAFC